ncbi:acyltransferase [Trichocoleus sp. FACHB-262]|uniref:acyltransferase n=1 Tax=Trichocoleus sp. FACHB-262 TaxID=2692869 RepID=UPI0016890855|nr:acyltransferase [Trichocoleus sp. FACHB-262]MBD2123990.1 acyltransferase [Trichocoleus sp. FACHB-262]
MNAEEHLPVLTRWLRHKESLVIAPLEGIPFALGIKLREWLYRNVLGRLGNAVQIQKDVEFKGTAGIEIGDRVNVDRGAAFNNSGKNNKICIEEQVKIRRNVELNSSGQNNTILVRCRARLGRGTRLSSAGQNSQLIIAEHACLDRGVDIKSHDHGYVEIGQETYIGPYTCIAGPGHVIIGKDCLIASHSGIYASNHDFGNPSQKIRDQGVTAKGIVIEDDCWLGSGVRVLDGVTIHRGSVVGAGAVVTKDIPPYSVAVGVPAKATAQRHQIDNSRLNELVSYATLALAQDLQDRP